MLRQNGAEKPRLSDLESWGWLYLLPAAQDSRQACMAECVRNARISAQEGLERVLTARAIKVRTRYKQRLKRLTARYTHGAIVTLRRMPAGTRRTAQERFLAARANKPAPKCKGRLKSILGPFAGTCYFRAKEKPAG